MILHPAPDQADELQLAKDYLHDALSYTQQRRRDLAVTALADAAHRLSDDPEIRTLADRIVRANGGTGFRDFIPADIGERLSKPQLRAVHEVIERGDTLSHTKEHLREALR